eukprot:CAMPEP_0115625028 /NCGR_PEP_ID=MMETSP0272-20121206/27605_1 /TAXON_ID=71861 /ORGANISM="Scrippsiella trochoidea, Strain CCMP3099" /LENGTH=521 /DNA_ID=CAMNT_0003061315 /DNA_START=39 /DNA_END=1600 /DNA_ORIENTATION=-
MAAPPLLPPLGTPSRSPSKGPTPDYSAGLLAPPCDASGASERPASGSRMRPSSGGPSRRRESVGSKGKAMLEWTPWKDRITKYGHRDAILFVRILEKQQEFGSARTLVTAAADGSVRFFALNKVGREPAVRQKLTLQPPSVTVDAPMPGMVPAAPPKCTFCTAFELCEHWGETGAEEAAAPEELVRESEDDVEADGVLGSADQGEEVRPAMFAGYVSGRIVGWEIDAEGTPIVDLVGHQRAITAIRYRRRLPGSCADATAACLISASHDGSVRIWSVPCGGSAADSLLGGYCLFTLDFGPRNPVSDFLLLPGDGLLGASWDGRLRHVDLKRRRCVTMFQACSTSCRSICASSGGPTSDTQIFVGTDDAHIASLSFTQFGDFERKCQWKAHSSQVSALRAWKSWLLSASDDRTIRVWMLAKDPPSGATLLEEFRGHAGAVLAISVSDTDRLLWSGGRDWTIRSWDLREVEQRVWERDRMIELDAESLEEEIAQRLAAKNARKTKKPKPKRAASAGANKRGKR